MHLNALFAEVREVRLAIPDLSGDIDLSTAKAAMTCSSMAQELSGTVSKIDDKPVVTFQIPIGMKDDCKKLVVRDAAGHEHTSTATFSIDGANGTPVAEPKIENPVPKMSPPDVALKDSSDPLSVAAVVDSPKAGEEVVANAKPDCTAVEAMAYVCEPADKAAELSQQCTKEANDTAATARWSGFVNECIRKVLPDIDAF